MELSGHVLSSFIKSFSGDGVVGSVAMYISYCLQNQYERSPKCVKWENVDQKKES